jgi:hypothetical protein
MATVYDDRLMDLPGLPKSAKEFVKPRIDTRHADAMRKIIEGADVWIDHETRKGFIVKVGTAPASGYFTAKNAAEDYKDLLMREAGK